MRDVGDSCGAAYGRTSRKAHSVRYLPLTPELMAQAMAIAPAAPRSAPIFGDRRKRAFGEIVPPSRIEEAGVRWGVVAVERGWERLVAADLATLGLRVYCPLRTEAGFVKARYGRKPRRVVRQAPVFAPYLFVGAPAGMLVARHLHGRIQGVLSDGDGRPLPVRAQLVRTLNDLEMRGFWGDSRRLSEPVRFRRGDSVRVTSGPFAAFIGVLDALLPREGRCRVELGIFGRVTPIDIEACDLERVCV